MSAQPPEGGWGWAVALGMASMFIVTMGPMASFGLIYGQYLTDLGKGTKSVTLITSILFTAFSLTGLVTNYSLKVYTCRQVGIFGGILYFVGNFCSIFASSVPYLIISFAVVPGIGMGLMSPASFACFNTYFLRRRKVVMSVAQVLMGAGAASYPLLVQALVLEYGFRGAQAILAAISLHTVVAMAALRPVQARATRTSAPHAKQMNGSHAKVTNGKSEIMFENGESMPFLKRASILEATALETDRHSTKADEQTKAQDASARLGAVHAECPTECPAGDPAAGPEGPGRRDQAVPFAACVPVGPRAPPRPSVTSVSSWLAPGLAAEFQVKGTHPGDDNPKKGTKLVQVVVDLLDLTLMKDPIYVNIVLGVSLAFFADLIFFLLLPIIVTSMGFTQSEGALCLSVAFAGDLIGRVFLVGMAFLFPNVASRKYVFFGALFSVVLRTVFVHVNITSYYMALGLSVILGFFRGWIIAPVILVFAEYSEPERFPSALGLYMVVNGLVAILLGPVVGFIRDLTGSYPLCVHSLSAMSAVCIVMWVAEAAASKFKTVSLSSKQEQRRSL